MVLSSLWWIAASTMAPTAPMAPASVGVARPNIIVPSTTKISTADGMMPSRHLRHSDDLRRHRAGDGSENKSDDDDRIAEPAADRAEQLAHRIQHVLGETAALEDGAHEREEGNRKQQFVGKHAAEDATGDGLQEVEIEEAEIDRKKAERKPERGEGEGHREADQHGQNQAAEHERRHHFQRDHCVGLSYFASIVTRFCSSAMRLITSDTPCSANITKPAGTTNLIGHRSKPPALPDPSPTE